MRPCSPVDGYQRFGGSYRWEQLILQLNLQREFPFLCVNTLYSLTAKYPFVPPSSQSARRRWATGQTKDKGNSLFCYYVYRFELLSTLFPPEETLCDLDENEWVTSVFYSKHGHVTCSCWNMADVLSCCHDLCVYRRGFGLDIGFIDRCNVQLVIALHYSAIADSHTL
jgi:hypothetical protein